jgi:hypothetical protein
MNERQRVFAMNAHLSHDLIADYFAEMLSQDAQLVVEEHVADCDRCALAAQSALTAGTVVDGWTARAHGVAARNAVLAEALAAVRVQGTVAGLRQRLEAWAEQWAGEAGAALRVVLEAPGRAARVIAESATEFGPAGAAWQLAPAPAAMPTRGAARRTLAQQPIVVTADGPDGLRARVAVNAARGEIVVRLDDVPPGELPPLVLLIPTGDDPADARRQPRLGDPKPGPGSDAWIARFEGLGRGTYLIAFEPRP